MEAFTIELDCAPGAPRPDTLLPSVLAGTGLTPEDFTNPSRLFGNWTFALKEGKEQTYKEVRDIIKEKVCQLYHSGAIRYGSW